MDLGEVQTRRSVRRENWLLCLHKPSSLLSDLPFLPYLARESQKRSRLALTPRLGRTAPSYSSRSSFRNFKITRNGKTEITCIRHGTANLIYANLIYSKDLH